ncbi:hypothetical protein GCM10010269_15750 [Streptomyces humidus]|uniref:Uncharacterized protein n=1 Tax=Streptomyces humidus TaxID=52259 RepID=A0A918L2G1_9ACTN|nr:hypothetical protein GCM10010269_15750 [Streptomyces humidus]
MQDVRCMLVCGSTFPCRDATGVWPKRDALRASGRTGQTVRAVRAVRYLVRGGGCVSGTSGGCWTRTPTSPDQPLEHDLRGVPEAVAAQRQWACRPWPIARAIRHSAG